MKLTYRLGIVSLLLMTIFIGCSEQVQTEMTKPYEVPITYSIEDLKTYRMHRQLFDEYNKEISAPVILASDFGMIPDDPKASESNTQILYEAMTTKNHIVIDDIYYLQEFEEPVSNDSLIIEGTGNNKLIFDVSEYSVLINVNSIKSIELSRLNISNTSDQALHLISNKEGDNGSFVERVHISNCTFDGNISLYRQIGSKELNPSLDKYGIGDFVFTGNKVSNTKLTFIALVDIPYTYVEIHHNTIRNFTYTFALMSISNDHPYIQELKANRITTSIYQNQVNCDDDWWTLPGQSYHCFVLTESRDVLYEENHVEGLKADFDVAIYDAYLSSNNVVYRNNTWKNNITFYSDKKNNTLLKAKTGSHANRIYEDNTFIVEEGFAERVGQSKEDLFVYFIDINSEMERYEITGNTFDVYDLRFQISSRVIHELIFNNNFIKSKYVSGRMFIIKTIDDLASVEFSHNVIEVYQDELQTFDEEQGNNRFGLLQLINDSDENQAMLGSLVMKSNDIIAPVYYVFRNVRAKSIDITDNYVIYVEGLYDNVSVESDLAEVSGINMTNR